MHNFAEASETCGFKSVRHFLTIVTIIAILLRGWFCWLEINLKVSPFYGSSKWLNLDQQKFKFEKCQKAN